MLYFRTSASKSTSFQPRQLSTRGRFSSNCEREKGLLAKPSKHHEKQIDKGVSKPMFKSNKLFYAMLVMLGGLWGCAENVNESPPSEVKTTQAVTPSNATETSPLSQAKARALMTAYTQAFEAAWASSSAAGLGALYAEDAVRLVSDEQLPVYGRAAIQKAHKNNLALNPAGTKISTFTEIARFLTPEIVLAAGTFNVVDAQGTPLQRGYWSNAMKVTNDGLQMLLESAGNASPNGMNPASLAVAQTVSESFTGAGAALLDQGVNAYVQGTNTGNVNAVANLFLTDGIQVVSGNDRIIQGRAAILDAMNAATGPEVTLSAWGYGYQEIDTNLAIGWGAYKNVDANGAPTEYGLWGNIWRITDNGLMLVSERAGPYSGQ